MLLIGDSIRMGYERFVRELLAGKAEVYGVRVNCGPSSRGVRYLDDWLGDTEWDVIHFNFGLHDIKYMEADSKGKVKFVDFPQGHRWTPLGEYETNLSEITAKLKATGAKLVFATTTPVPEGTGIRRKGDAALYNLIALRVMRRYGVQVNIFYSCKKGQFLYCQDHRPSQEPAVKMKGTLTDYNLYWCAEDPGWGKRFIEKARRLGVETHSLCADPGFLSVREGDLQLKPDSPAFKLGIRQPIRPKDVGPAGRPENAETRD